MSKKQVSSSRSPSALMLGSLSVLLTLFLVCAVLWVGQSVQGYERRLDSLHGDIEQEKERVRVLRAEWARLNTPERLEFLRAQRDVDASLSASAQLPSEKILVIPVKKPPRSPEYSYQQEGGNE